MKSSDQPLTGGQPATSQQIAGHSPDLGAAAKAAGEALAPPGGPARPPLTKLVIAIHGIGDQSRYSTAQSVVTRFGEHFDFPAAAPLGNFHAPEGTVQAFRLHAPPELPDELNQIGFMEVYWADIPRGVQKDGFTIEESKAWARTVVQRVRARYGEQLKNDTAIKVRPEDFSRAAGVLDEMIETLRVLSRLTYLADKAGLMKFDLDELLTNFLGDVQIVADFPSYRAKILEQFRTIIDKTWKKIRETQDVSPEIYFVAHSEGTVVVFQGLLQAMAGPTKDEVAPPARPEWIDHVRGLMTIGSPLDKHIILWPEMWRAVSTPGAPPLKAIRWKNYYDHGDPVGFDLNTTRDWMEERGWKSKEGAPSKFFEFEGPADDHGFTRYLLPGAAHNEYWGDDTVFGHFIQNVMELEPGGESDSKKSKRHKKYAKPPQTRRYAQIGSYTIPYLLAFGILYGGVYLLFNVLRDYQPETKLRVRELIGNVAGVTFLITGLTLAVRIPRLTRIIYWRIIGWILFAGCAWLFLILSTRLKEQLPFAYWPGDLLLLTAGIVALLSTALSRIRELPDVLAPLFRGLRPLLIPGGIAVAAVIGMLIGNRSEKIDSPPLWPLILAGAAFLYLWWLAALIFDLVFVWHRYVRNARIDKRLRTYRWQSK